MVSSISAIHRNIWFAILTAITILTIGLFLMHNIAPVKKDVVATGFLFDIVITFPAVYYFLIIRPFKQKKWRIVLVVTCCCAVGYLILPAHQRGYIIQLRKLTMLLEAGVLIYCFSKIKQVKKIYDQSQNELPDMAYNFHQSMAKILGDGAAIKFIASELTILRFGLFFWLKQKETPAEFKRFSIYKETGYTALFGIILFACLVELVAFHFFLRHYSPTAAIIVTLLSIYGFFFLIGDFSAILQNPVLVLPDRVLLRTGLRWRALVQLNNIASIEKVKDSYVPGEDCHKGSLMKSRANILFRFTEPVKIERLYRKAVFSGEIVMTIDNADELITQLNHLHLELIPTHTVQ